MTARLSKKRVKQVLNETRGTVYAAAERLGCSHQAVYNYINRYDDVAAVKEYWDGHLCDMGELALRRAVMEGEPWAVKYVLSTKGKDRGYVYRQEVEDVGERHVTLNIRYPDDE